MGRSKAKTGDLIYFFLTQVQQIKYNNNSASHIRIVDLSQF